MKDKNSNYCKDQLNSEVLRIANKLRGVKLCDCCKLINDYLRETVTAINFTEKMSCSNSYDALILKKSTSCGFISAFIDILRELGVKEEIFSPIISVFTYNGKEYRFQYLRIRYIEGGTNETVELIYSPYTEKLCNQNLINHDIWFRAYTREL